MRFLILFLVILFSACGQHSQSKVNDASADSTVTDNGNLSFTIIKATAEDFLEADKNYRDKLIRDTISIKKVNGILEIPIRTANAIIFKDTLPGSGSPEEKEFRYIGQYKSPDVYLVEGMFWEHYECYLIDKRNGTKTTTWNKPELSPSSDYFANLSLPYGIEGIPNGVQIWKIDTSENDLVIKHLELDQQIWVPLDLVWETENSVILKVTSIDNYSTSTEVTNKKNLDYLRLRF